MQSDLLFLFNRGQGQLQYFKRCFFKPPFAGTAKVMRCIKQTQQRSGLLLQRGGLAGVGTEVVTRQISKAKFIIVGKFPGQFQLNVATQLLRSSYKFSR